MKKNNLIAGFHVVECRNGNRYLVFQDKLIRDLGWFSIENVNDDLTYCDDKMLDIIKVYRTYGYSFNSVFTDENIDLAWERKEYVTFDEARRSDKKFKYKDWCGYSNLKDNIYTVWNNYTEDQVNEMLDSKEWEIEK